MTEEEAKTKWCHQANANAGFHANCIGSRCMAWRWDQPAHDDAMEAWEDAANIGGVQRGPEPLLTSYGYCGLAGKP